MTRDDAREVRRQEAGPRIVPESKPFTFRYTAPEKQFTLEIKFRKSNVSEREVADALKLAAGSVADERELETEPAGAQDLTVSLDES